MCGIAGIIGRTYDEGEDRLAPLVHRGPDGRGELRAANVWLGHTRLAIIDLSDAAKQPMTLPDCGTLVFNGEIYNHAELRERYGLECSSSSDTEVLLRGLARAGPQFVQELRGMYALAWLRPGGRELLLARDHAGMKPLWVWEGKGAVAFASEIRSLAPLIRAAGGAVRTSLSAIRGYLRFGSVQEPLGFLSGVEAVPPATTWRVDTERATVIERRTAQLSPLPHDAPGDPVGATVAAVRTAVARHLVSDRKVALFLSGGLDSGVLAVETARCGGRDRVHAVTVRLGSSRTEDEPQLVRALTRRLDLRLEEIASEDLGDVFIDALEAYDQPSVDGLNTYLISAAARRLGFAVALSGVGADEVFGGYALLRRARATSFEKSLAPAAGRWAMRLLARSRRPGPRRVGILLEGARLREPRTRSFRRLLGENEIDELIGGEGAPPPSAIDDVLLLEQRTYLLDTLLRDTDVMGMANGVEIRAPYLDPDVMATARSIGTTSLLAEHRPPKWLLREGWSHELEPGHLVRPKTGFTLGLAQVLERHRPWVDELMQSLSERSWIDKPAMRALTRRTREGDPGHAASWARTLLLLQLELHVRRWGDP